MGSHSETPITLPSLDWRNRSPNSEPKPFHTHSVPVTVQKHTWHFNRVAAPIIFSNFALVYVVPSYRIYSCFFTCLNYTHLSCPPQVPSFFTSYLFFGLCVYHVGSSSLTRDQTCAPLHLEPGVLATGPPVNPPHTSSFWLHLALLESSTHDLSTLNCSALLHTYHPGEPSSTYHAAEYNVQFPEAWKPFFPLLSQSPRQF